jgi:hypothetical protein
MDIIHLVKLNMLIQHVFLFSKILFPFAFNKSTSFKNSMCLFDLWKKKKVKGLDKVFYMFHNEDFKQTLHI